MKQKFHIITRVLCLVMVCALLAACTGNATPSSTPTPTSTPRASTAPPSPTQSTEPVPTSKYTLPFEDKLTIKYWMPFDSKFGIAYQSYDEVEIFQYIEELLNVDFQWIEPSGSTQVQQEQFGLMIASGDLPDVISAFDRFYTGGAISGSGGGSGSEQGFEDGLIIDIEPYINEEIMPNLTYFFSEFPELRAQSESANGGQLTVPYYRHTEGIYSTGWIVRQDILDENNWAIPETIQELDQLLYNMKSIGVKIPLLMGNLNSTIGIPSIAPSWGMRSAYEYQIFDTHEVRFGAVQPEYKEMLDLLRKWYADGILDPDFMDNNQQISAAKMAEGLTGVWFGARNADGISPWNAALDANPDSKMVLHGIPDLKQKKSDVVTNETAFSTAQNYQPNNSVVITTQCKDPERVLFALDWLGFNNDGIALVNYGIEGQHWVREADGRVNRYVDVNGSAEFRMDVDKSIPQWKKLATGEMAVWGGNAPSLTGGIIDYENHILLNTTGADAQVQRWFHPDDKSLETRKNINNQVSQNVWQKNWAFSNHEYIIPSIRYTQEQTAVRGEYYNSIRTFIEEYSAAYIIGTNSGPDTFDKFVSDLYNTMNLQKVIDVIQEAVDEYYSR